MGLSFAAIITKRCKICGSDQIAGRTEGGLALNLKSALDTRS